MSDLISPIDNKIRECVSVLDSARWNLVALAEEYDKRVAENESLRAQLARYERIENAAKELAWYAIEVGTVKINGDGLIQELPTALARLGHKVKSAIDEGTKHD